MTELMMESVPCPAPAAGIVVPAGTPALAANAPEGLPGAAGDFASALAAALGVPAADGNLAQLLAIASAPATAQGDDAPEPGNAPRQDAVAVENQAALIPEGLLDALAQLSNAAASAPDAPELERSSDGETQPAGAPDVLALALAALARLSGLEPQAAPAEGSPVEAAVVVVNGDGAGTGNRAAVTNALQQADAEAQGAPAPAADVKQPAVELPEALVAPDAAQGKKVVAAELALVLKKSDRKLETPPEVPKPQAPVKAPSADPSDKGRPSAAPAQASPQSAVDAPAAGNLTVVEAGPEDAVGVERAARAAEPAKVSDAAPADLSASGKPAAVQAAVAPDSVAQASQSPAAAVQRPLAGKESAPKAVAASESDAAALDAVGAPPADSQPKASQALERPRAPASADQDRLIARISNAIAQAETAGRTTVRMRLYPPELGTVRIEVSSSRGVVTARIEASTPAAQAVLQSNIAALKAELRDAGVELRQVSVEYRDSAASFAASGRQHGREQNPDAGHSRRRFAAPPVEMRSLEPVGAGAPAGMAGVLDVFV